jgi:hypothetical protein
MGQEENMPDVVVSTAIVSSNTLLFQLLGIQYERLTIVETV